MMRLLMSRGADLDAHVVPRSIWHDAHDAHYVARTLLADVRRAGSWAKYVLVPRQRVLALRVLCDQGRTSTDDDLLRRLFPAAPPPAATVKRARQDYRAAEGGRVPRGIFWLILEYWRCDRDSPY